MYATLRGPSRYSQAHSLKSRAVALTPQQSAELAVALYKTEGKRYTNKVILIIISCPRENYSWVHHGELKVTETAKVLSSWQRRQSHLGLVFLRFSDTMSQRERENKPPQKNTTAAVHPSHNTSDLAHLATAALAARSEKGENGNITRPSEAESEADSASVSPALRIAQPPAVIGMWFCVPAECGLFLCVLVYSTEGTASMFQPLIHCHGSKSAVTIHRADMCDNSSLLFLTTSLPNLLIYGLKCARKIMLLLLKRSHMK